MRSATAGDPGKRTKRKMNVNDQRMVCDMMTVFARSSRRSLILDSISPHPQLVPYVHPGTLTCA